MSTTPQDQAMRRLAAAHLHRSTWLPATDTHPRLRVTFATSGNFDDDPALPAVLFISPMFATRWLACGFSHLASTSGVRIIAVDRPGFGGSTPVALAQRVAVWRETVPAVLAALGLEHVAGFVCHSAGAVYLLNSLVHHRRYLDPARPYAALLAPWVHSDHSDATLMNLAARLPTGMVKQWGGLNRFLGTKVAPISTWSGGLFSAMKTLIPSTNPTSTPTEPLADTVTAATSSTPTLSSAQERYGVTDPALATQLETLQSTYFFAEQTAGLNDEALTCLRREADPAAGVEPWGVAGDYEAYVRNLVAEEKTVTGGGGRKLVVDLWFAESDIMIGEGGRKFMEKVWRQDGVADGVEVRCAVAKGTDHETVVLDRKLGVVPRVLATIAEARASSIGDESG